MPYDPHMPAADTPLAAALERVGDRWSLLVIEALLDGPRRFNELTDAVRGIAPNILADRLRRLESERILRSTPYSERPPRFAYSLTDEGAALAGRSTSSPTGAVAVPPTPSRCATRPAARRSRRGCGARPAIG